MYINQKLWSLTTTVRGRIAASVAMGLGGSVLGMLRLLMLGWLIAQIIAGAELADVWPIALGTFVLFGFYALWDYQRLMLSHKTAALVQHSIRTRLFDQFVALGPAHFARQRSGEVSTAAVEGVEQLEIYFGQFLPQFFVAVLTPFVIFAVVATLDMPVAFVLLLAALFTLLAPSLFHRWDTENSLRRSKAYRAFASEFLDSLQGLLTLKAFGQSKARQSKLADQAHELFQSTMWVLATNSLSRGITDIGIALGAAAALALSAYRVSHGLMSFDVLLIVLLLGVEVFRPLRELRGLLHNGMLAESAAKQVFSVLECQPTVEDNIENCIAELPPGLSFQNVSFHYANNLHFNETERGVVHAGLNFNIDAGERVGIVGRSGGGKSTIVRLLLRFYDPQEGVIRIGETNIRDLPLHQLREQFAVVSQDTYLFHGTVRENLLLGNQDCTEKTMRRAAVSANALDFILALPEGFDTIIGERGARLSGGQRQRLSIARALLRDAPVLILDEALSSVDAQNEAVIQSALDRLMLGRTTIVLAHRLSSIIACDRILVLDQGHVAETGTHVELMQLDGMYARLMEAQVTDRQQSNETGPDPIELSSSPETSGYALNKSREPISGTASRAVDLQSEVLGTDSHSWYQVLAQLLAFAAPWKARLIVVFALGVGRVLAFTGVSILSALAAVAVKRGSEHTTLLLVLAGVAVTAAVLHWLESWLAHDMAFRMLSQMRIALFRKLDELAPAFILKKRSGDLINLATHDVEMVEYFFAHTIAPVFVAMLVPLLVLALLASFDFILIAGILPWLALVILLPILMRQKIDALAGRARTLLGAMASHTVESLQGLGELIAYQATDLRRAQFIDLIKQHHAARLAFFKEVTKQVVITDLATLAAGLSIIIIAAFLVSAGRLDSVYIPLLALAAMAAFLPVIEISDTARQLAETFSATNRLMQVHGADAVVSDSALYGKDPEPLQAGQALDIEFKNVSFYYDEPGVPAVNTINLKVAAGTTLAIVGGSGAGKSTLVHLLLRFWDPQHGTINVGGHDIQQMRLAHLRQNVALVAQDTYLFNDTLKENLLMARPGSSDAEVMVAIQRAQLGEFVRSLPQGMETTVGERGYALSGGQRQRVSIARAFLRDAPVLILDEATSHLDALSEQAVHQALGELMQSRTTVVIAHRLATIRDADNIAVMQEGEIVETGTHAQLLIKNSAYSQLLRFQMARGRSHAA